MIGPGCAGCIVFGEVAELDCMEADCCDSVGEVAVGDVACVCGWLFCGEVEEDTTRKDSDCECPCCAKERGFDFDESFDIGAGEGEVDGLGRLSKILSPRDRGFRRIASDV